MKPSETKMAEMKSTIDDQKNRIAKLVDQLHATDMSLRLQRGETETAKQEIEKLKQEKADLLSENVRLLEKLRELLRGDANV